MKNGKVQDNQLDEEEQEDVELSVSEDELERLQRERDEFENKWKRALADYQNLEKRVRDEKSNWILSANADLLSRLLPAIDMLMLAEKHTTDEGVKMTVQHMMQAFKDEGIERIGTVGKKFDPMTMEVVATDKGEDGKVLEELRAGYMLRDKVLRPAQVKVGSNK